MKTEETKKLELAIWNATSKQGTFGCFEVTIGWFGKERVDYMTYDTKGIFRCYEIKVSKADFRSKAAKTFVGNYNYFVMPSELYDEVKAEIPAWIGVYVQNGERMVSSAKKAKYQQIDNQELLKDSLIRSLTREVAKQIKSEDPHLIWLKDQRIDRLTTSRNEYRDKYNDLLSSVIEKYGTRWNKDNEQGGGENG